MEAERESHSVASMKEDQNGRVYLNAGASRRFSHRVFQCSVMAALIALLITSNILWYNSSVLQQGQFDELQDEQTYNEMIRPTSTIVEFYESCRDSYVFEYNSDLTDETIAEIDASIAASLARHDIGTSGIWPHLESSYHEVTGSFSFLDARMRMNEFLNYSGLHADDSLETKIERILDSINQAITYVPDIHQRLSFPWETLWLRTGDCDDYAILAAALFELVGVDSAYTMVYNSTRGSHAIVLVHMHNLNIPNLTYYPDLTEIGLSEGVWAFIEPQLPLGAQIDFPGKSDIWIITASSEI